MITEIFTVWRRSDGYVAASNSSRPLAKVGETYSPATAAVRDGVRDTFECLLVTKDWEEARKRIVTEREAGGNG